MVQEKTKESVAQLNAGAALYLLVTSSFVLLNLCFALHITHLAVPKKLTLFSSIIRFWSCR